MKALSLTCVFCVALGFSSISALAASESTSFKVQTSSAAPGNPASNINDGAPGTAWSASPQKSFAGNFVWIEADLGAKRYVDRVVWTSPSAASALANYAIKVSDDGKNWVLATAEFTAPDGAVPVERSNSLGKDARYVRIETTKIGDGSGQEPARIAELTIMSEAPRNTGAAYRCDKTVTPSNYVAELEGERGNNDGAWKTVCIQPGNYAQPVRMHHMRRVRLLAQAGGVVLKMDQPAFDRSKFPKCVAAPNGYTSVLSISESQEVFVKGLAITNDEVGGDYRKELSCGSGIASSRAVIVRHSSGIWFEDTSMTSAGKNTLTIDSSSVIVKGGSITGWYFLADPTTSTAYFNGVKFNQRENPAFRDDHTMFSTHISDVVLDGNTYAATSGNGFLGGTQVSAISATPDHKRKWVLVGHNESNTSAWLTPVGVASGYKNNVQLYLTGTYPRLPPFTRTNGLVAPGTGDRVCSFASTTAALLGCVGPDLPVVADVAPSVAGDNLLGALDTRGLLGRLTTYRGGTIAPDLTTSKGSAGSIKVSSGPGSAGISVPFPSLTPGTAYVFSFWAKAASEQATVSWNIQSGRGDFNCLYGAQIPLSTTWKNYSKTCVLDESKTRLLIYAQNNRNDATFWIEGITVRPAAPSR